ncbi:hypothetical protein F511_31836 [Dorcoceras hygrometricum]|uniref:Uncharacterized protein n=1 Tax=Dorcoceras hygrometricum TaxID=472368 RepID=A0A2Z7BIV0_9LAMI|nr:hypothetical protein F511_31836 [Dorcoceras hygrometricum]
MLYVGIEVADREKDATLFELVATPRIDVAAGSCRGWLFCSCEVALDSSREALPFYTSFRSCNWLVEEREVAAVRVLRRPGCEGERRYHTLISLLGSLATMRRVVNYHSSWARQRQVEQFDAYDSSCSRYKTSSFGLVEAVSFFGTSRWFMLPADNRYVDVSITVERCVDDVDFTVRVERFTVSISHTEIHSHLFVNGSRNRFTVPVQARRRKTHVYVVSHTVEAVVHLWSLGVLTAAGCGIGSVHAVVRSNLLVEPSEVEEGEM